MDNQTVRALLLGIAEHLEGVETRLQQPAVVRAARADTAPATLTQGFLSGRWQRRDGNVYGGVALERLPLPGDYQGAKPTQGTVA
jgi:hypothetical protein